MGYESEVGQGTAFDRDLPILAGRGARMDMGFSLPGLGFLNLLSSLGRHLEDALVYVDPRRRVLRIAPGVVERAAQVALGTVPVLSHAEARVAADHVVFDLQVQGGTRLRFRMIPCDLVVEGHELCFRARIPGGLQVGHDAPWMAAMVTFIDGIFRLSEAQTNAVPGLHLEGEELEYRRSFAPTGSQSWLVPLVQFVQGLGWSTRFPVTLQDGWLELEVGPRPTPE